MRDLPSVSALLVGVITSPTDYRVVTHVVLQKFNGTSWDEVK